jgi:hypothetical protein
MALIQNLNYNNFFVEAQRNYVTKDPYGNEFIIYTGMQFKFPYYEDVEEGCSCNGTKKSVRYYIVNAFATCGKDVFLWDSRGFVETIKIDGTYFVETDSIKFPPIVQAYEDETSGKDIDRFTPPWMRSIPREGGLWYTDPWQSKLDS